MSMMINISQFNLMFDSLTKDRGDLDKQKLLEEFDLALEETASIERLLLIARSNLETEIWQEEEARAALEEEENNGKT